MLRLSHRTRENKPHPSRKARTLVAFGPFACQMVARSRAFAGGCPMKLLKSITLLLVLAPALATVQAKTKKPYQLPAVFNQARYVYVEAVDGQEFDPRLIPEDRQAIADVYKALYDWKRYVVVTRRDEADLIFVVRKGRLAQADVGVLVGSGPQIGAGSGPQVGTGSGPQGGAGRPPANSGPSHGVGVGGEAGPPDDLLEVYMTNPNEAHGTLVWQHTLADGLDRPDLPLFKQLKDEVEHDYPIQAASKQPKP